MDLTKVETVQALMASSRSASEWEANAEKVRAANGGEPSWWHDAIVASGVAATAASSFLFSRFFP